MGNVSWQFKKFAEDTSKRWQNKIFSGFTNSGSINGDKQITLLYLQTLAYQHGGIWVSLGILPSSVKSSTRNDINSLGRYSGLLGQTANDAGVEEMFEGDLKNRRFIWRTYCINKEY